jgi:hypothetical protein
MSSSHYLLPTSNNKNHLIHDCHHHQPTRIPIILAGNNFSHEETFRLPPRLSSFFFQPNPWMDQISAEKKVMPLVLQPAEYCMLLESDFCLPCIMDLADQSIYFLPLKESRHFLERQVLPSSLVPS